MLRKKKVSNRPRGPSHWNFDACEASRIRRKSRFGRIDGGEGSPEPSPRGPLPGGRPRKSPGSRRGSGPSRPGWPGFTQGIGARKEKMSRARRPDPDEREEFARERQVARWSRAGVYCRDSPALQEHPGGRYIPAPRPRVKEVPLSMVRNRESTKDKINRPGALRARPGSIPRHPIRSQTIRNRKW
jgi:hypothetical protein